MLQPSEQVEDPLLDRDVERRGRLVFFDEGIRDRLKQARLTRMLIARIDKLS